jgi:hypothetical protein
MVQMFVYRVGIDPRGRVLLILADEPPTRLLPMVIGQFEAKAIAMELVGQRFERPITHDLLHSVVVSLGHRLERVDVVRLEDETFYAELTLRDGGDVVKVDSRPSDAIALALRAQAPIYVAEAVLERVAVRPEDISVEEEAGPEEAAGMEEYEVERVRRLLEGLHIDDTEEQ